VVILAWLGLALALSALGLCVWHLWASHVHLSENAVRSLLSQSSDELRKIYDRQLRDIETEWTDMYKKFSRLVGRVDKEAALSKPRGAAPEEEVQPAIPTRADLLRNWRRTR